MSHVKRRITNTCAALSLAVLALAPCAQAASKPTAATGPNTPFLGGKVRLLGYVGPEGAPITACKFIYGPEPGSYAQEAPCANHPGNEIQSLEVRAIGGQFRLLFEGQESSDIPFDATAAEVQSVLEALPAIGAGGASVQRPADIPGFRIYLITFEGQLADTNVGQLESKNGTQPLELEPELSLKFPITVETVSGGGLAEPHETTADLVGLAPGATYHYRLVAENAFGVEESPDAIFRAAAEPPTASCPNEGAPGTALLSECRAWEMVSPPAKNGGDVTAAAETTRIAADGSAAQFLSPSAFGDASGAGARSEYESVRTPSGWQTHGILPPQPATTLQGIVTGLEPRYEGGFSADLNTGVFFAWRPLDQTDPNVEAVANLYLRDDLRSPGAGHYRLLTACPLCAEAEGRPLEGLVNQTQIPIFVAASADFKHVLFLSRFNLARPANSGGRKLYENEDGQVRLVGILPSGLAAAESFAAEPYVKYQEQNHIHAISSDGSKVFWSDGTNLYMRVDHQSTFELNKSELETAEEPQPAYFGDATPDGSKVFFSSKERLTEDAPEGGGIYVYNTIKPASDPHNLTFLAPAVTDTRLESILGVSADGSTVYFSKIEPVGYASGPASLQPGASPPREQFNIYVWHDGAIRRLDDSEISKAQGSVTSHPLLAAYEGYRVTPAGQLLFASGVRPLGLTGQFPGYCPEAGFGACIQFYSYDPATEALQCVSCSPPDRLAQAIKDNASISNQGSGAVTLQEHMNNAISADGEHVFFNTRAPLVAEDTNGVEDAYTFNTSTSRVSLLSSGTDPSPSTFLEVNPGGTDALIATRQRLSGWDTDSNIDLYDVRIDGGLPEPLPRSGICESEPSCRPAATQPPNREPTSSESVLGTGNPTPACPHGSHLVREGGKARCVKLRKHRKRRRHSRHGGHR